jgi:hypothetical protein
MSNAAKARNICGTPLARTADNDVLHFLTRTLQAHMIDAEPQGVLAKLQNLKTALEQQETTLSEWPESPSKARICTALAKAKNVVAQIVDDLGVGRE